MVKVLADFHHTGLYYSLKLLFEDRLGMELYRPIGGDWLLEGFWRIAEPYQNDWQTLNQYLSIHQEAIPQDPAYQLNEGAERVNGIYKIGWQRAIELQTFKHMKFDYLIPSIPLHYRDWHRLRDLFQPQAKVICQVGNSFEAFPFEWTQNLLSSSKASQVPQDKHVCFYHQEFPLDIFAPAPLPIQNSVSSFLHQFSRRKDYELWLKMQEAMPEWEFREYGSGGKEPYLVTDSEVAQAMLASRLVVHFKEEGDGYGHIIHNLFAMGRVVITKKDYYCNRMAGDLMIEGKTCFFWRDDQSVAWNIERILSFNLDEIGANAYKRFKEIVDFDKEAVAIQNFLKEAL